MKDLGGNAQKNSFCQLSAMGIVSALGNKHKEILKNLLSGPPGKLTEGPNLLNERKFGVRNVKTTLAEIPEKLSRYRCRNNALALTAFQQIEERVESVRESTESFRMGVVMGTSTSGMLSTEQALRFRNDTGQFPEQFDYAQHEMNGLADFIAEYSGITGPAYTISTACSSSAKVFASGRALLEMGLCDAVVIGGSDSLCEFVLNGFSSLEVLSPEISNPLSQNRQGINLGEGACVFLMKRMPGGIQLRGVGESSDAHHMSSPDPQGRGAQSAMQNALNDAKMTPDEIQNINLHGTATRLNDEMESRAVQNVFPSSPFCSSTKPFLGHCLGAAGSLEAGVCWLTLTSGINSDKTIILPPHSWDEQADTALPELTMVRPGQSIPAQGEVNLMSSSFGFGGNNFSLILSYDFD